MLVKISGSSQDGKDDNNEEFTAVEAQLMIQESDLLSELMDAWSTEVTNLLEQISLPNDPKEETENNDNNTTADDGRPRMKSFCEWKPADLQQIADQMKSRMADKSKQALEKHRTQQLSNEDSDEEVDDGDEEEEDEDEHGNKNVKEQADGKKKLEEKLANDTNSPRILLSKLSDRKDTELQTPNFQPTSNITPGTQELYGQIYILKQQVAKLEQALNECNNSKVVLVLQTSAEIDRMRELLRSYNPSFRYRRILDEFLEEDRYQKLLDKLSDDTYEPHELDALLAHIAHLKRESRIMTKR